MTHGFAIGRYYCPCSFKVGLGAITDLPKEEYFVGVDFSSRWIVDKGPNKTARVGLQPRQRNATRLVLRVRICSEINFWDSIHDGVNPRKEIVEVENSQVFLWVELARSRHKAQFTTGPINKG